MGIPIDPVYLPFDAETLVTHFARVKGDPAGPQLRHLAYYQASAARKASMPPGSLDPKIVRRGLQMQKDERFWIAASLMTLCHSSGPASASQLFADLLRRSGMDAPDWAGSWESALSGKLHLYFEANLNSPATYRKWLVQNRDERAIVPYLREAASGAGTRLEGPTKVDAILLAPETKTAVVFEAKVLSDLSTHVSFDATRNQLARIIDVVLDDSPSLEPPLDCRDPDRTYVVLVTPKLMSPRGPAGAQRSRLYGWLLPEYQDPNSPVLAQHLPHRHGELSGIHARLGWVSWEEIDDVCPGSCRWLRMPTAPSPAADDQAESTGTLV